MQLRKFVAVMSGKVNQFNQSDYSNTSSQEAEFQFESSETEQGGTASNTNTNKTCIFETWANKIVMVPFDIAVALLATFWTQKDSSLVFTTSFPCHPFFFILMLGFYASVTGIMILPTFPKVARGFYMVAFFCVLVAVTIFFDALLPKNLKDAPWICLVFVLFMAFQLSLYEQCCSPSK